MPKKKIIKKDIHDKFYTKPDVAELCVSFLKLTLGKELDRISWVEPSAGDGAFSSLMWCKAYDILPENEDIVEQDWFDYVNHAKSQWGVFGNPPFGNRNSLSKSFIKHSIDQGCSCVGFVLPKVFQKYTMQKVFPETWKLIGEIELPKNSFTLKGESYNVPCVFQIWVISELSDKPCMRSYKGVEYCEDFCFNKKGDGDLFMFGASPSKTIPSVEVEKNNRGYYLTSHIGDTKLINNLKKIDWKSKGKSSVSGGVSWFTKSEIIEIYKEIYNGS